jgi:serine phosphatase RsbU (regulator of sigma subunit)/uncharacterized protein YigA (DUF484 family)
MDVSALVVISGLAGLAIGAVVTYATVVARPRPADPPLRAGRDAAAQPATVSDSEGLHRLAAALSRAASSHDVGMAFLDQALQRLGAQGGSLVLRSADGLALELIAGRDLPGAKAKLLARVPLEATFSVTAAYRTGRPVAARSHDELVALFPTSAQTFGDGAQAIYALPIHVNGEAAGAFNMFFDHAHEVSAADAAFLATMAQLCGQALERALLADAESTARLRAEEAARYATSLYALGMRLAGALTLEEVASTVMREAVAEHGAVAAVVLLIDEERQEVELLAEDGYPAAALAVLRRFSLDAPIPAAAAARTSSPVLIGSLAERQQKFPLLPDNLGAGSEALACLPLSVADRTFGVLVLRYAGERAFSADERRFLLTLADDCSQALDRARLHAETERLYEREHHIAQTLQAGLLPAAFPNAPGLEFAAAFAPMGPGNDVGGDFYDVFPKGDAYSVVVGDVCGKGPEAAKLTSLCRYTLRTSGMLTGASPRETLALLNRAILEQTPEAPFSTVAIADLSSSAPGTMRAVISTGGHPPPLIARRDGAVEELKIQGSVLGVLDHPVLAEIVAELAADDLLIFVTDGVEETKGTDDTLYGYERLRTAIEQAMQAGQGATAGQMVTAVQGDLDAFRGNRPPRDDVIILAVRITEL